MRLKGLTTLALAAAAAALAGPTSALAAEGPCLAGVKDSPQCQVWDAKIAVVEDGDTVQAQIKQGNKFGKRKSVRLNGLQAMELHNYGHGAKRGGDCHSLEASNRLEQLIDNQMVRLTAQKASSVTTGEGGRVRLRRSIAVERGGKWIDVGSVMLAEGHGLWFPNGNEWASNGEYSRIAQVAAARGIGIWDPDGCGVGPSSNNPLTLKLRWDAEDDDTKNINGEWVRIKNAGATPVPLRGWSLRDSHFRGPRKGPVKGRGLMLPANAVVPAGGSIKVHVGSGSNNASDLYWGLNESIFGNATDDQTQTGDGAYLLDPKGNLRAYTMYPCRTTCTDPLAGKLKIEATYKAPEFITVTNTSAGLVDLAEAEIESSPWFYEIEPGTILAPRQTFTLYVMDSPGPETKFVKSWGWNRYLLSDRKDVVTLRNPRGDPVACHAWGGEKCPSV